MDLLGVIVKSGLAMQICADQDWDFEIFNDNKI